MSVRNKYIEPNNQGDRSSLNKSLSCAQHCHSDWWVFLIIGSKLHDGVGSTPSLKGDQTVLNLCRRKISGSSKLLPIFY